MTDKHPRAIRAAPFVWFSQIFPARVNFRLTFSTPAGSRGADLTVASMRGIGYVPCA
jgi:hypothetical protein